MQRGITKSNRLEANSSPIAEPSVKAVSLKRNKTMKWLKTKIDNKKNRYAIEDDGYAVAEVVGETTANLMASAPEMFETLQFCLGVLANAEMTDKDLDIKKAYSKVFHTIAKAEGK